ISSVEHPARAAAVAAMMPAGPPPTTTTSNSPYTGVCLPGSMIVALLTYRAWSSHVGEARSRPTMPAPAVCGLAVFRPRPLTLTEPLGQVGRLAVLQVPGRGQQRDRSRGGQLPQVRERRGPLGI